MHCYPPLPSFHDEVLTLGACVCDLFGDGVIINILSYDKVSWSRMGPTVIWLMSLFSGTDRCIHTLREKLCKDESRDGGGTSSSKGQETPKPSKGNQYTNSQWLVLNMFDGWFCLNTNLDMPGKRESQLMRSPHKIGPSVRLWQHFLDY